MRYINQTEYNQVIGQLLEIENLCFGKEAAWRDDDFAVVLDQSNCIGVICEIESMIGAYVFYQVSPGEVDILNLAVRPCLQRKGFGAKIIGRLKERFPTQKLIAYVRESSLDTQLFFRSQGFKCVGIVEDYFEHPEENCYLFVWSTDG